MSATDIQILLASVVAALVAVAGGVKWLVMYIAAKQSEFALAEATARSELSARLHEEIRILRTELTAVHAENRIYLRRIFQLEGFLYTQRGVTEPIPIMEGWPPK